MPQQPNIQFNDSIVREDSAPVVISPYGFKEIAVEGQTYLQAMTKEEYIDALQNDPSISAEQLEKILSKIENNDATCFMYTTMRCATSDNCQVCNLGMVGVRYYCYCGDQN